MPPRTARVGALALAVVLLAAAPVAAVITAKLPLAGMIEESRFVLTVRVDRLDPDKPSAVLTADEDLKGTAPFRRLALGLKGDSEAAKQKQTPQLLKRMAPKLPLVLFVSQREKDYVAFAYTNGTWFQLTGTDDGGTVRWAFTHCEPYLRRTYAGSTAELRQVVADALAGKAKPPEVNAKEKPGLGPEAGVKPEGGDQGVALPFISSAVAARVCSLSSGVKWLSCSLPPGGGGLGWGGSPAVEDPPHPNPPPPGGRGPDQYVGEGRRLPRTVLTNGPPFAVIPTVVIGPVLMALAALFPAVFGGLILVFRRWTAALAVASLNSTLYLAWDWANAYLVGSWWGTPAALWLVMSAVTLMGMLWAWRRHVARLTEVPREVVAVPRPVGPRLAVIGAVPRAPVPAAVPPPVPNPAVTFEVPGLGEVVTLAALSVACIAAAAYWLPRPPRTLGLFDKTLLLFAAGVWASAAYLGHLRFVVARRPAPRPRLPAEGVFLGGMLLMAFGFATTPGGGETGGIVAVPDDAGAAAEGPSSEERSAARLVAKRVLFRPGEPSWIASSPTLAGGRIYVGAVHGRAFTSGAVYCLEADGRQRWMFNGDRDRKMQDVFSSPCVAGGRVYVGEGFHQHLGCKLYCLDADTGAKLWDFPTGSHTESSPCVAGGMVYFGAGDDGLYCLDAATGKEVWHLNAGLHVDANPLVGGGRVYCGSGVGDTYKETCVFCLDAATGKEVWRVPTELPVWGGLAREGSEVYVGTGNGNFVESDEKNPAGAVLCLDAATGARRWRFGVKDGVHVKVASDSAQVYFGSRDGHCYCLGRLDGVLRWKRDLGGPVVASPALARCSGCGATAGVYVASGAGKVFCLDAATGRADWAFDLARDAGSPPESTSLYSSPAVAVRPDGGSDRRRVYLGCGLDNNAKGAVYCLEDEYARPAR